MTQSKMNTTENMAHPEPLKRGSIRYYFPQFPEHPLNGAAFEHCGPKIATKDGLIVRDSMTAFEASENNLSKPAGYWDEAFEIVPQMFGVDEVEVTFWFCGEVDERFYLTTKNEDEPKDDKKVIPMDLGSETGSLVNHVYSKQAQPELKVGMLCTKLMWTDRYVHHILEVESQSRVRITRSKADRTDSNGMSDSQSYTYSLPEHSDEQSFWIQKFRNRWYNCDANGKRIPGSIINIAFGVANEYYDYSF